MDANNDNQNGPSLREIFESLRPNLRSSYMRDVPPLYLRQMAVGIHSGLLFPNDWRICASFMGIPNRECDTVQVAANADKETPMYLVMHTVMRDRSIVDLIDALFMLHREDVICFILPYLQHVATTLHEDD